jgi:hypothetical protein
VRIYRWDLDKTYLDTDIHSWRGLFKSALEQAASKKALPGATELVLALQAGHSENRLMFLSGSPTQMRRRLEEKLKLDGIDFHQFILKDNLKNLRRGRLRAIQSQFGYKLPRLLEARSLEPLSVRESLFGDDSEVDAWVYSVYADVVAGRVSSAELARILELQGAYPDHVVEALAAARQLCQGEVVERIFILLSGRVQPESLAVLGSRVLPVRSWLQAALVLVGSGEISVEGFKRVYSSMGLDLPVAKALCEDACARGLVSELSLKQLNGELPELVENLSSVAYCEPKRPDNLDYIQLLGQRRNVR